MLCRPERQVSTGLHGKDHEVRLHDDPHHEAEDEAVPNDVLNLLKVLLSSTQQVTEAKFSSTASRMNWNLCMMSLPTKSDLASCQAK